MQLFMPSHQADVITIEQPVDLLRVPSAKSCLQHDNNIQQAIGSFEKHRRGYRCDFKSHHRCFYPAGLRG